MRTVKKIPVVGFDLDDPLTMGEDLRELSVRVAELAGTYCTDCSRAHERWIRHRIDEEKGSVYTYFPELVGALLHSIEILHRRGAKHLRILIAGSADTGLLALCANASRAQRLIAHDAVRIHVIDQCRTPLILCEEFAARHELGATTQHCKIPVDACGFVANLILASSLLRYFPFDLQPDVMNYLADHQETGGMIVYAQILARTPAMAERPGSTADPESIRKIIAGAGYGVDQETVSDRNYRLADGAKRHVRRYIAVATKLSC